MYHGQSENCSVSINKSSNNTSISITSTSIMSLSSGKMRRKTCCFTRAIALLFIFQIWFVLSETNGKGSDDIKEAVFQQSSTKSGKLFLGEFEGKEIIGLAANYPPFFYYKKLNGGNFTFGGIMNDHLELIFGYLKMRLKYVIIDQTLVAKYGQAPATYIYLEKKEIYVVPAGYVLTLDILKYMELVTPLYLNFFTILQPYPDEESRLDVIIRPFNLPVWICLLIITAVFVVVSAIIIKNRMDITDSTLNRQSIFHSIYNQIDYVVRLFTNQGTSGTHARTRSSFKMLTGIWLLSVVVLINAYSGVLTSLLTAPRLKPIAKTLKDVAESQELRVTCEKDSYISRFILDATNGYAKILGDQIRKDPTLLVTVSLTDALENVINRKAAFPGLELVNNLLMKMGKKRGDRCQLAVSPGLRDLTSVALQLAFPIGSPYAEIYSKTELLMWANGMIEYTIRFFKSSGECRVDNLLEAITRKLTLVDLWPAFFILGVGISLSAFCFVLEILSKYILSLFPGK